MSEPREIELLERILAALERLASPQSAQPAAALSVDEAAAALGCSRTRVFELLRDGTLTRARRMGRRVTVLAESVERARRVPERTAPQRKRRAPRADVGETGGDFGSRIRALKV